MILKSIGASMILFCVGDGVAMAQPQGSSCAALGPKAVVGVAAGGAIGAGIGAAATMGSTKGTMLGGLIGAVTGAAVGNALDQRDCQQAQLALKQIGATRTGQQVAWNDPDTGNHGYLLPTADAKKNLNGQICRPYQGQTTLANGDSNDAYSSVVCRNDSGDWVAQ